MPRILRLSLLRCAQEWQSASWRGCGESSKPVCAPMPYLQTSKGDRVTYKEGIEQFRKEFVTAALQRNRGFISKTARELKIGERMLRYYVKKYQIDRSSFYVPLVVRKRYYPPRRTAAKPKEVKPLKPTKEQVWAHMEMMRAARITRMLELAAKHKPRMNA